MDIKPVHDGLLDTSITNLKCTHSAWSIYTGELQAASSTRFNLLMPSIQQGNAKRFDHHIELLQSSRSKHEKSMKSIEVYAQLSTGQVI